MTINVSISGQDNGNSISWSREITMQEAVAVMAKFELRDMKERKYPVLQNKRTHAIQDAILDLASNENISELSLRKISEKIGGGYHPQRITHHLNQLMLKGWLDKNRQVIKTPNI